MTEPSFIHETVPWTLPSREAAIQTLLYMDARRLVRSCSRLLPDGSVSTVDIVRTVGRGESSKKKDWEFAADIYVETGNWETSLGAIAVRNGVDKRARLSRIIKQRLARMLGFGVRMADGQLPEHADVRVVRRAILSLNARSPFATRG